MKKWTERRRCHGSIVCCQYVDSPDCNTWDDPHLIWRFFHRRQIRRNWR